MGKRTRGKTLDRKNPFGHYEPGNCQWSTSTEQAHNKRPVLWPGGVGMPKVEGVRKMQERVAEWEHEEIY
jgi:hypothetical protein